MTDKIKLKLPNKIYFLSIPLEDNCCWKINSTAIVQYHSYILANIWIKIQKLKIKYMHTSIHLISYKIIAIVCKHIYVYEISKTYYLHDIYEKYQNGSMSWFTCHIYIRNLANLLDAWPAPHTVILWQGYRHGNRLTPASATTRIPGDGGDKKQTIRFP